MSDTVIKVSNLSKRYILDHQAGRGDGLRHVLQDKFTAPWRAWRNRGRQKLADGSLDSSTPISQLPSSNPISQSRASREEFWALRDVSFEVKRGEVVGIIGRNGAGKSTLLKILSRITEPTSGRIEIDGRVASLLEVGTGFHPELTGRENIFLNGAILGMKRSEIRSKFDEIVSFAEVEKFLDTPVKRYSSGMYVRLAFSVAAHLEPEILIIDEVLAVGDMQFQKKCLGKLDEASQKHGRTVFFVSHNLQMVSALTSRCLLMKNGVVAKDGTPAEVIKTYFLNQSGESTNVYVAGMKRQETRIHRITVGFSEPANRHVTGRPLLITAEISCVTPLCGACFSIQIVNSMDHPVVHVLVLDSEMAFCRETGTYLVTCRMPTVRLYLGEYSFRCHLSEAPGMKHIETITSICPFEVITYAPHRDHFWQPGTCAYLEECEWSIEKRALADGSSN